MTSSVPQPTTINSLRNGVHKSVAMAAGVQLDLFTQFKDGAKNLEQVADALNVQPIKLRPLFDALVIAGLLEVDGERFSNTDEANHFLVKGAPGYLGNFADRLLFQWEAMLPTAETIRTGIPQSKHDFSNMPEAELEAFFRSGHNVALRIGQALARERDFSSVQTLADVGGGSGGVAIAVTEAHPDIMATVLDLPSVTPITRRIVEEEGASKRVNAIELDILQGVPDGSYDVVVMKSVIQVLSPKDNIRALKNIRKSLTPGGTFHIIGKTLDDSRQSPISSVLFNLLTLNIYDDGGAYTLQEHRDWLAEAGYDDFDMDMLPDEWTLISARNPG